MSRLAFCLAAGLFAIAAALRDSLLFEIIAALFAMLVIWADEPLRLTLTQRMQLIEMSRASESKPEEAKQ